MAADLTSLYWFRHNREGESRFSGGRARTAEITLQVLKSRGLRLRWRIVELVCGARSCFRSFKATTMAILLRERE
ncbi:unnamed protein product [Malus baccata var. baccata]